MSSYSILWVIMQTQFLSFVTQIVLTLVTESSFSCCSALLTPTQPRIVVLFFIFKIIFLLSGTKEAAQVLESAIFPQGALVSFIEEWY